MDFVLKNKNMIVNLAVVLVFIIVANLLYAHFRKKESALRRKHEELIEKQKINADISFMDQEIALFEKQVFKGDMFDLRKAIEEAARNEGITIRSLRPKVETIEGVKAKKGAFEFNANASYDRVVDFISVLEQQYFAKISHFSFLKKDSFRLAFEVFLE